MVPYYLNFTLPSFLWLPLPLMHQCLFPNLTNITESTECWLFGLWMTCFTWLCVLNASDSVFERRAIDHPCCPNSIICFPRIQKHSFPRPIQQNIGVLWFLASRVPCLPRLLSFLPPNSWRADLREEMSCHSKSSGI